MSVDEILDYQPRPPSQRTKQIVTVLTSAIFAGYAFYAGFDAGLTKSYDFMLNGAFGAAGSVISYGKYLNTRK